MLRRLSLRRLPSPLRIVPPAVVVLLLLVAAACSDDTGTVQTKPVTSAKFNDDVVPIIATNCALSACHAAKESNLGIHLTYEKDQIYAELQKTSAQSKKKFVVADKPEESYLIEKMDGVQCKTGCGAEMPPGELIAKEDRDIVRAWIKAGAKND